MSDTLDLIINAKMTAEYFTNDAEFEKLYASVKEAVDAHVPDVSTKEGRDAIKSLAFKVARTKTALIGQGKQLTESWRAQTKAVNATCNKIESRLDALKADVREPLTLWENEEAKRVAEHEAALSKLKSYANAPLARSSAEYRRWLEDANAIPLGPHFWHEFAPQAAVAKADALETLARMLRDAEEREAEALELKALREEKAERDRQEAKRIADEEKAKQEAERAEREAKAEADRKEAAERKANAEAAERVAAAERRAKEAEERAARAEKEAAEKAVADQRAKQEAERKRQADATHRTTIIREAEDALATIASLSLDDAAQVMHCINTGLIPHVSIKF